MFHPQGKLLRRLGFRWHSGYEAIALGGNRENDNAVQASSGKIPSTTGLAVRSVLLVVLVCAVIALFFAILIGGLFELFRFSDHLLTRPWGFDGISVTLAVVAVLVALFTLRLARRLALVLLGLVTTRYDEKPDSRPTLPLDGDLQSAVYQTVEEVCRQVQAPRPDEVRLAALAECYVLEEREFSIQTRRKLTLVLGLPEMLLMTVSDLRVIIAHELVHFRSHHTTMVVFLFRFLESLRRALQPLSKRSWRWADPVYWIFWLLHRLVSNLCLPIQRLQELRADAVSAAVYGGELAVHTLLKDWLVASQFDLAVEEYRQLVGRRGVTGHVDVYRFFLDRWREYSPESQEYLERRLVEEDAADADDDRPTMRSRLRLLRSFPDRGPAEPRPVSELLADLSQLRQQLHDRLLAAAAA